MSAVRGDERSAMFRPLTDVSEVTFAAYSVTVHPSHVLNPGALNPDAENPHAVSGALLRAILINAVECGGALAIDDLSKTVGYTYASGTFHALAQEARPLPTPRTPTCGECGQWESEHRNPNGSCCDKFDVEPSPDSSSNPRCLLCRQPFLHHGRPYTIACHSFLDPMVLPDPLA
ncbi:hypothetical protein [Streptomyces noursei]|uniref:hypothetical protein n=1 Tax=Streptomyces noursei TaxID=1971 RepID=UPI0023B78640|nr:hypothetical protein [Streptomyces noursei]